MKRPLAIFLGGFLGLVACGSDDGGGGGAANPCVIDTASDDCQGRGTTTVKYDCKDVADRKRAEGLGCVPQDPNDDADRDVCCAPVGGGTTNNPPGGGTAIACQTKAGDDDCQDRKGFEKKFDCEDTATRDAAIAAGCVKENADKPDSNDLCCPASFTAK